MARKRKSRGSVLTGKVRVHDPFELVRWLALSQSDPRKAMAELVQNSLDAGARRIRVTRVRRRGTLCLEIRDDGAGVIPEFERPEALRYIATHIGHSRKRSLSPKERLELLTQGQYGIGLLGFWSVGESLEIRSSVPGQRPHRLILHRDRPEWEIEAIGRRDLFDERWTEVVVVDVHKEAMAALGCRRAADYLAAELRGQLLAREVELIVEDRVARGRAEKIASVEPKRFLGEPVEGLGPIELPGRSPVTVEIYLTGEDGDEDERGIALYAGGTQVAGNFRELGNLRLDRRPWTDPRLTGLVDAPDLTVAPGSRRGVVPDAVAAQLAGALRRLEPRLREALEETERRRAEELDRNLVRSLQRAFRGFYRDRSRYSLLPVAGQEALRTAGDSGEGEAGDGFAAAPPATAAPEGVVAREEVEPKTLFPPGPLASVELTPAEVRMPVGTVRRVRARPVDAAGRRTEGVVEFRWSLASGVATLVTDDGSGSQILVKASDQPGVGALAVQARSEGRSVEAEALVEVVEKRRGGRSDEGIPEPELIDLPGAGWRSRLEGERWQVNTGHPEYRAIRDSPALKLRYLSLLFAKEVVLRSSNDPRLAAPLEQLVEVAAYADRNLRRGRKGRRRSSD